MDSVEAARGTGAGLAEDLAFWERREGAEEEAEMFAVGGSIGGSVTLDVDGTGAESSEAR